MPYISLQYHRQVPAPGPIFQWQGIGRAWTWRSTATAWRQRREAYRLDASRGILQPFNEFLQYCRLVATSDICLLHCFVWPLVVYTIIHLATTK